MWKKLRLFLELKNTTNNDSALGFLLGDMLGSPFEGQSSSDAKKDYLKKIGSYTDDTLMYLSVLKAYKTKTPLSRTLLEFYNPNRGYGQRMDAMLKSGKCIPTDSWGNGSATRSAALALFKSATLLDAENYCKVTHTHKDAVLCSKAVFLAVRIALTKSKNLAPCWEIIGREKPLNHYSMGLNAMESIPPALIIFQESSSFEQAIKRAICLGGDTDSIGAVTGALAAAFYDIPNHYLNYLKKEKKIQSLIEKYLP